MELKTENDSYLVHLVREFNDPAKDYLYEKYSSLIHSEINKFKTKAKTLDIDPFDLSQEAMLAFSHAINNYKDSEDTKFMTFATLCIRRRLSNFVSKYETNKSKMLSSTVALDKKNIEGNSLIDSIEDETVRDPLSQIINEETLLEINKSLKKLSGNEKMALQFYLMGKNANEIAEIMNMSLKQIYNLLHRARNKVKQ